MRDNICLDETVDRFSGKHLPEAREGEKMKGLTELGLENPIKWKKIGGFGEESENEDEMGEVVELERQREGKSWLNQIRKGNEMEGGREKYLDENQEGEALAREMAREMKARKIR